MVIHNISLPPGQYGGDCIERLFTNCLDWEEHPYFTEIRGAEVTRFKGLGEISPGEFGQFIGDDGRLASISVQNISEVSHCLDFFMGKNTPERKAFIIENLVTDVS